MKTKEKAGHTPGPWRIKTPSVFESLSKVVAIVGGIEIMGPGNSRLDQTEENESNAQLIISAPELLEAVQRLYTLIPSTCNKPGDDCEKCKVMNLMAKAEGRIK